jgi:hypothetical protein
MQPEGDAERLLILTMMLEIAIGEEDWPRVSEILFARASLMQALTAFPEHIYTQITVIEDRTLTALRRRLGSVRADMRNLSAALKIAAPYTRRRETSLLSLAG